MTGRGIDAMKAVWHHDGRVTSGHPTGDWAFGWDEVLGLCDARTRARARVTQAAYRKVTGTALPARLRAGLFMRGVLLQVEQ